MTKPNRRTQRTRERLQKALMELIGERGYDTITIQHIVEQADVGRTTFYLHFRSKDELFMYCHESIIREFRIGPLHPFSREELLSPVAPLGVLPTHQHLEDARVMLNHIFQGKNGPFILRQIRDRSTQSIEANLRSAFADARATIPLEMLAIYLAGAQIALVQWWLAKRRRHTFERVAEVFHRLQRAAIHEAFELSESE